MELTLNVVWLFVAVGTFAFWRFRWTGVRAARRTPGRPRYVILALGCALLLLFPVISLTDDLHGDPAVMEESTRSVLKAGEAARGCLQAGKSFVPAASITRGSSSGVYNIVFGNVLPAEVLIFWLVLTSPSEGRSPPHLQS